MRFVLALAAALAACGGTQKGSGGGGGAEAFVGARFVPANPTYVLEAPSFRAANLALLDTVDVAGMLAGGDPSDLGHDLQRVLGVNALDLNAVGQIGVDINGPWLAFSEDVDPTFVIQLADPKAMTAFLDGEKAKGLKVTSMIIDSVEVFTAKLQEGIAVSWAIDKNWMWIHFADVHAELGAWFEHSHKAGAATWGKAWDWAKSQAKGQGLIGFANLRDAMAVVGKRVPEAAACVKQFDAVERVGLAFDTDGKTLDGKLTFDIGDSAQRVGDSLIKAPPGWAAASQGVAIAAQWNLDARFMQRWLAPCFGREADNIGQLMDQFGVRTARAVVQQFDPDDKSGVGAVVLDLEHNRYIKEQLDQVPMRSRLEKDKTYGQYQGKHLAVPFVATVDYVLTDKLFIAAMGDGVLTKLGTGAAPSGPPAIASVDVVPSGLKQDVWQWLFEQIDLPSPKQIAAKLQTWQNLHVGARLDGTALVIEANGARR